MRKDESVLQEKISEKLFNRAEVAKLNPEAMRTYDESLKVYRDNYSVIQTAKHEGREEERLGFARRLEQKGVNMQVIAQTSGVTEEQITNQ